MNTIPIITENYQENIINREWTNDNLTCKLIFINVEHPNHFVEIIMNFKKQYISVFSYIGKNTSISIEEYQNNVKIYTAENIDKLPNEWIPVLKFYVKHKEKLYNVRYI